VARSLGLDPGRVLDLSASLNPFAPDLRPLLAHLVGRGVLGHYPGPGEERAATAELAGVLGVDPGRVLLTNGGAEAVALVAGVLRRGRVEGPEFSLYARHLEALDPGAPRWRSDPHNPGGTLAADDETATVWDEAFYPLATGRWSRTATGAGPGRDAPALSLGSATKTFACPGLRLGWVVVPEDDGAALGRPGLRGELARRRPEWSVSPLALAALPHLLAQADLDAWARAVARGRRALTALLAAHGLDPQPSAANFVLARRAEGLRSRLAPHAVVVRDTTSFGLPGGARVAVPDEEGLDRLARALEASR
jgi:histidinol-phosphate/aromatic aminotransferase/cobyric acid decarboxylase-like protein